MEERPDNFVYENVYASVFDLQLMVRALEKYQHLLQRSLDNLKHRSPIATLFADFELEELPPNRELRLVSRLSDYFKERLPASVREDPYRREFVSLSHGTVRLLKSVLKLYFSELQSHRDHLLADPMTPVTIIQAVDGKLAALDAMLSRGVFEHATPSALLVEFAPTATEIVQDRSVRAELVSASPRVLVTGLQVLDPELKARCLDLFDKFSEAGADERFDTVLREAATLLEDRLRTRIGASRTTIGRALAAAAFSGPMPKLRASDVPSEQEGVGLLFLGFFAWFRNARGHSLAGALSKERVQQELGFVDLLLDLVERCGPAAPAAGEQSDPLA
jgi:hypothetical protein